MSNKSGIELIAEERQEQIGKHGRTVEQDIRINNRYQLSSAAHMLALEDGNDFREYAGDWAPPGWDKLLWLKMMDKPYKERLIIAGALLAAEIDRVQNTDGRDELSMEWIEEKQKQDAIVDRNFGKWKDGLKPREEIIGEQKNETPEVNFASVMKYCTCNAVCNIHRDIIQPLQQELKEAREEIEDLKHKNYLLLKKKYKDEA